MIIEKVICYINTNKRMYKPWWFREVAEILHLPNVPESFVLIQASRFEASLANIDWPENGSNFICFRPSRTLLSSQQTRVVYSSWKSQLWFLHFDWQLTIFRLIRVSLNVPTHPFLHDPPHRLVRDFYLRNSRSLRVECLHPRKLT